MQNRYFSISNGLRGCYMPDSVHVAAFKTRRDLKSHLESEAAYAAGNERPPSKRKIAAFAALAWREAAKRNPHYLPFALPLDKAESYALFIGVISRAEYLESQAAEND